MNSHETKTKIVENPIYQGMINRSSCCPKVEERNDGDDSDGHRDENEENEENNEGYPFRVYPELDIFI